MAQFLYKYRGRGLSPALAKGKAKQDQDLAVLQETERELVLAGPTVALQRFGDELSGWFFAAVKNVPRPPVGAKRHPPVKRFRKR
jgi:hypothetical protein